MSSKMKEFPADMATLRFSQAQSTMQVRSYGLSLLAVILEDGCDSASLHGIEGRMIVNQAMKLR